MQWTIPFFDLQLQQADRDAVMTVLDRNWLTVGEETALFESEFGQMVGAKPESTIAVTNCTAGLHLALAALGVGAGDEVICPSLTFVATANAAWYCGATPVFADIVSEDDWTIDPDDVAAKITPRTKAVIVVHYGGHACDMDRINAVAKRHGLFVVEDTAHAPLATRCGSMLGTIGDVGCFSFFSNKNLTTGEGGIVIARDNAVAQRARLLSSHALTSSSYERFRGHAYGYDVGAVGYNYRIDEMRAALGRSQIPRLPANTAARRVLTQAYTSAIERMNIDIRVPFRSRDLEESACHIFPVLIPASGPDRDTIMRRMGALGVQTSFHYKPIHRFSMYGDHPGLPVTDAIAPYILSLPLYPHLGETGIATVLDALRRSLTEIEPEPQVEGA